MGARGNSGVITSQIFRGMAEGLGGKSRFNGLDLAHALSQGARTAYGAVAKPVEGTILTVIRESADAAVAAAEHDNDIETVLAATRRRRREVGRPDAEPAGDPARGRRRRLGRAGAVSAVPGGAPPHGRQGAGVGAARGRSHAGAASHRRWSPTPTRASATRRCSCSSRTAPGASTSTPIRDHLESIGESVLVAGDARALKVHVHNERPDLVVGYGLSLGDAEPDQHREPRQPGARRPRDAGRGVHRGRRRPGTPPATGAGPAGAGATGDRRGPPMSRRSASSASSPVTAWPRSSATSGSPRSSRVASRPIPAPASCWRPSSPSRPARSSCSRTTRT